MSIIHYSDKCHLDGLRSALLGPHHTAQDEPWNVPNELGYLKAFLMALDVETSIC